MQKEILYIMYTIKKEAMDYDCRIVTRIHGIFTSKEVSKYRDKRRNVHAKCMIVPLNKFVENGVEL